MGRIRRRIDTNTKWVEIELEGEEAQTNSLLILHALKILKEKAPQLDGLFDRYSIEVQGKIVIRLYEPDETPKGTQYKLFDL